MKFEVLIMIGAGTYIWACEVPGCAAGIRGLVCYIFPIIMLRRCRIGSESIVWLHAVVDYLP